LFVLGLNLNGCSQAGSEAAANQGEPATPTVIDGTVDGLSGTLVLRTNTGEQITVSSAKSFPLSASNTTELTILQQPADQTCTVAIGPANAAGIVTDVTVTCVTRGHSIGGSIAGLRNAVVLQNNLGDTLSLTTNGPFTFPAEVAHGTPYSATVLTQPIGQICLVDASSGVTAAAVTDINVNCLDLPGVSGTVSGLGGSLVLQENGGPQQTLTGNGSFYFPRTAGSGSYSVTIFTQPGGQVCNIANGSGAYGSQASMNVAITCTTNAYPIGGFISGLRGTLKLQNNGGDDKELSSDGEFSFTHSILHGGTYSATVQSQPTNQICTISRNNGFATNAVGDITVSCVDVYTISGTISGLTGTAILQNNNGDNLTVSTNGQFTFHQTWPSGTYAVSVYAHPIGQKCTAANNNGSINGANVTGVTVACTASIYAVGGSVSGLSGTIELQNNGGGTVTLDSTASLAFKFPTVHGASYSVTISKQPATQVCTILNATGTASADVTNISVSCTNTYTVGGTVTGLSGTVELQTGSNERISVSANGSFKFPTTIVAGSYAAQVASQPVGQICTMTQGSGTVVDANVTQIAVTCSTNTYSVGGDIIGLKGEVVLQNNGGDNSRVSTNGQFTFSSRIAHGNAYAVTVLTQPAGQTCAVTKDTGIATANITQIAITCTTNSYSIGGTVNGLNGSVTLQNNSGETLPLSANGTFAFPTPIAHGGTYSVKVSAQPAIQTCTVTNGSGTATAKVTQITVNCAIRTYAISGTITGLSGSLVLRNNGGNDLTTSTNGAFVFTTQVSHGDAYSVAIQTQSTGQFCTVLSGSGTATAPVSNVAVNCVTNSYPIGGTLSGLNGTVVLQNNGGNNLTTSTNGGFNFSANLTHGSAYTVTVFTQPAGQICTVTNGSGTATAVISNIAVNCVTNTYSIGGTVAGLVGTLVLRNNGANDLTTSTNGGFTFATNSPHGSSYSVAILTQPTSQTCTVTNGFGTATAAVSNIAVSCATNTYSIGGTIAGLIGTAVLRNNGTNDLTATTNGAFTFTTKLAHGGAYSVVIFTQPTGQTCTVTNGSGTATAAVTQVSVNCASTPPLLSLSSNIKQLRFSWTAMVGATYYKLMANQDGASGFTQVGTNLTVTNANVDVAIHRFNWSKASYLISACNASNLCADSNTVFPLAEAVKAIGYVKASNTGAGDAFGASIAISGDGKTLAVAANLEDSGTSGTTSTANEAASDAGAVYVYTNASGSWAQQAYIKASNPGAGDFFGASIALSADGNTLAVGANSEDSNTVGTNASFNDLAASAGAVYVFTRSANVWTQQAYLKASTSGAGDEFGRNLSLAADGKTLAIGAMYEDSNVATATPDEFAADSGAVYVFVLESTGWRQTSYVKASNIGTGDLFGSSVAVSPDGNTLAVGAPMEDGDSASVQATPNELSLNSGATYIFTRNTNVWTQQAYLKAANAGSGDAFGGSVALSSDGNTLAVGAVAEASSNVVINGVPNENAAGAGAVYVYIRTTASWTKQAFIKASNAGAGDTYGTYVALSADGNLLAVGAPGEDSSVSGTNGAANESALNSGAVYVYARSGGSWGSIAFVKAANTDAGDSFGGNVSLSTDGNTLVVGAKAENGNGVGLAGDRTNNTATSAGAAYLY